MNKLAAMALALSVRSVAGADINLTPLHSVRELEGCKFPQVEFRDGGKRITYQLPAGWRCMPRDRFTAALVPPNDVMVSAKIKFIPTPGPLVLDDVQLNHFKETAPQLLPAESKMMTEPIITPNPVLLNTHATCEVDILFALHSQRLRMSILFVDLGDSQLRFSLIARASDFEALHKAFQESWYTWQWVE